MDTSLYRGHNTTQFQGIFQDLLLYGDTDHERIVIKDQGEEVYPATARKEYWSLNAQEERVSTVVLSFLENHLEKLTAEPSANTLFLKLDPFFQGEPRLYFNVIHQNFFRLNAQREAQAEIAHHRQEFEKKLEQLECTRIKEMEASLKNSEDKHMGEVALRLQMANEKVQTTISCIQCAEQQQARLKEKCVESSQFGFDCRDGVLYLYRGVLDNVAYFKSPQHAASGQHSSTAEGISADNSCSALFSFKSYSVKTLDIFIKWLENRQVVKQVVTFQELLDLYRLAVELQDSAFSTDCLVQTVKKLNHDNALKVLSRVDFPPENPLIQCSLNMLRCNLKVLKNHPRFVELKRRYVMALFNNLKHHAGKEMQAFKALMIWGQAQAKKNNLGLKELFHQSDQGGRLIDCIHWDQFTYQEFVRKVKPLGFMSADEENQCLSRLLKAEEGSKGNFYAFRFTKIDDATAKIAWNIPIEIIQSLKNTDPLPYTREFSFHDSEWIFIMGKSEESIIFTLVVKNAHLDFDYFLELPKLRCFSHPPDQPEIQYYHHPSQADNIHIKAIKFRFADLEGSLDASQKSLPLKIKLFLK